MNVIIDVMNLNPNLLSGLRNNIEGKWAHGENRGASPFKTLNPNLIHPSRGLYGLAPLFSPCAHFPSILFPNPLNKFGFKFITSILTSLISSFL